MNEAGRVVNSSQRRHQEGPAGRDANDAGEWTSPGRPGSCRPQSDAV